MLFLSCACVSVSGVLFSVGVCVCVTCDFFYQSRLLPCYRRGQQLLRWLHACDESYIAVVTHWVFLSHLFAPFPHPALHQPFGNAEMRFATLVPKAHHLPTPGQHGHSPQRHTAAGTAAPTTADLGNTVADAEAAAGGKRREGVVRAEGVRGEGTTGGSVGSTHDEL